MTSMANVIRALARSHTYNLRRNPMLGLGLALGCLAGLLSGAFAAAIIEGGPGRSGGSWLFMGGVLVFLAPPVLLGLLLGALGTVLKDQEAKAGRSAPAGPLLRDPSTGLYSSACMQEELRHAISQVARTLEPVTILVLEPADPVNEPSLAALARSIQPYLRQGDLLGRIDPDRLLLIVHGTLPCALCLIDRIAEAAEERMGSRPRAGVARWPEDGRRPEELTQAADRLLESAFGVGHVSGCRAAAAPAAATAWTTPAAACDVPGRDAASTGTAQGAAR